MIYRTFRYAEGDLGAGWLMDDAPDAFDPLGGMGVAHDILEEFPGSQGTLEDELLAQGAILWLRGQTGYLSRNNVNPAGQHLTVDIIRALEDRESAELEPCPIRCRPLDDWFEQQLDIWAKGIQEECPEAWSEEHPFFEHGRGWVRRGFRLAERRYRRLDAHTLAYCVFQFIEETVNQVSRDAGEYSELAVTVSPANYATKVRFWPAGRDDTRFYPCEVFTNNGFFSERP